MLKLVRYDSFQSLTGYSSHLHNPFLALTSPRTTETHGQTYGFSLIYSGSHSFQVEKGSVGLIRVLAGMHTDHLSWPLGPKGGDFTTPECVAVFSDEGLGGMSRKYHSLYRGHLCKSRWVNRPRPALINNWEATYFDMNQQNLARIAQRGSELGVGLFVMDDGWFGVKHPRLSDNAGLGDWVVNPERFPDGLGEFVKKITGFEVKKPDDSQDKEKTKMKFGIWVEPEMVNPASELFEAHPEWALQAEGYPLTEARQQLVLDLSQTAVQDYIIDKLTDILNSADISYVKWDNNRGMHELPSPSVPHAYMLGLYRVLETLTTRFPEVLWEGCASGGGRFDPGLYHYWAQSWTSDNTDAIDRLFIQFGTSLVYPPSSMGAHVSAVPNHQTGRTTPLEFRAHVALMGGSFGFELDLNKLPEEEQAQIPRLVALSEKVNPLVITGDLYRLERPDESNWPTAMFVSPDKARSSAVLLAYRMQSIINWHSPPVRLQGLDPEATYELEEEGQEAVEYTGRTLMNAGLHLALKGDYQSRVIFLRRK
jgi:alpha-galactosidase